MPILAVADQHECGHDPLFGGVTRHLLTHANIPTINVALTVFRRAGKRSEKPALTTGKLILDAGTCGRPVQAFLIRVIKKPA